ncbi:FAD-binding protein [Oleispirillum naphthae]|uniref:FAD-binding protein n=1 Tax=Oleispirillum naphthae TaxID=2838853 RepID=UPI0030826BC4
MSMNLYTTDVLVIGSGFAGNRAALGAAEAGAEVLQVTLGGGGSPNIMGFSAAVTEGDSSEVIFDDLMKSGMGMNCPVLAETYARGTDELIADMEALGVPLKKGDKGRYAPLHSLGTAFPRLVHQYQCLTGNYIQRALNKALRAHPSVTVRTGTFISDLLVEDGRVYGACGVDAATGELLLFRSRIVVLAAGGSGRIHAFTTYPADVSGDGMAMAYRAGLDLQDMELIQFEPCCFVAPERIRGFVNPTTFFKMGATLKNGRGEAFIDDCASLQKDVLSRKIITEVIEGRGTPAGGVYYDVTMIPEETVKVTHYVHYQPALEGGVDICREVSEVAPAAHSFQGGAVVNPDCSTAVDGLYLSGEVMGGIHGANRMGGDAGGAALVFGKVAGRTVGGAYAEHPLPEERRVRTLAAGLEDMAHAAAGRKGEPPAVLRQRIQEVMQARVGLIKTEAGLTRALAEFEAMEADFDRIGVSSPRQVRDLLSVRNMLLTARAMALCARERRETRGVHYREDFPERDDAAWFGRNAVVGMDADGGMTVSVRKNRD